MMRALAVIACLAMLPVAASAIEKVGPEETHGRETSGLEEYSLKPVKLYSPRGRRDPFVPMRFGVTRTARPETLEFSISRLRLSGFIEMDGRKTALFSMLNSNLTYSLRGGRLYSSVNEEVKQVRGRILSNGDVELRQGERKLVFKTFKNE